MSEIQELQDTMRLERLKELQRLVGDGTYFVPGQSIAEAIVNRLLGDETPATILPAEREILQFVYRGRNHERAQSMGQYDFRDTMIPAEYTPLPPPNFAPIDDPRLWCKPILTPAQFEKMKERALHLREEDMRLTEDEKEAKWFPELILPEFTEEEKAFFGEVWTETGRQMVTDAQSEEEWRQAIWELNSLQQYPNELLAKPKEAFRPSNETFRVHPVTRFLAECIWQGYWFLTAPIRWLKKLHHAVFAWLTGGLR